MKYRSLLAVLLAFTMIFAVSCTKNDNSPDNSSMVGTSDNSSSEQSSDSSEDSASSPDEYEGTDTDDLFGDNMGDADFTDLEALYKSPIQQTGTPTRNSPVRSINV